MPLGKLTAKEKAATAAGNAQEDLQTGMDTTENTTDSLAGSEEGDSTTESAASSQKKKSSASILPSFMSILAVLAGGAYKIWSRRLF